MDTEENVVIYHHHDQDGYLAATIANEALDNGLRDIRFAVGSYNTQEDRDNQHLLEWADLIYVLDYTLTWEFMLKYREKIIWIDHHISKMEHAEHLETEWGITFAGVREIGKSGCLLAWEWFNGPGGHIPKVVQLVNDRDVWEWKFGDDTAAFHEASSLSLTNYKFWRGMLVGEEGYVATLEEGKCNKTSMRREFLSSDDSVDHQVFHGHEYLPYIRNLVDEYNKQFAWEGTFEGYPVVFLNGSKTMSGELHKRLRDDHQDVAFAVVFMFEQNDVRVGLYRQDHLDAPDLSKISSKYGGGGHAPAAGFMISHEKWIEILKGG
jgi:oligoribonuclease NrnB/cAMP/cGMP phosphodiesterase (DHH superfamily)